MWIIEGLATIILLPFQLLYLLIINIDNLLLNILKSPFILFSYLYEHFTEKDDEIDYEDPPSRHISQSIKDKVWNRDSGKCVKCGSNEKIEFDHIIPIVSGGKSTYRNLQLLCEFCNRSKGAKIE
tara:strand:+ start:243 stop:617 length:375 start_codon:yes stop_codon:yes gene_type:complete